MHTETKRVFETKHQQNKRAPRSKAVRHVTKWYFLKRVRRRKLHVGPSLTCGALPLFRHGSAANADLALSIAMTSTSTLLSLALLPADRVRDDGCGVPPPHPGGNTEMVSLIFFGFLVVGKLVFAAFSLIVIFCHVFRGLIPKDSHHPQLAHTFFSLKFTRSLVLFNFCSQSPNFFVTLFATL